MKIGRAVLAGVLGVVLVYAIVWSAGKLSDHPADLCLLLGSSATADDGGATWALGAAGQLAVGIIAALVYAAIFEWVTQRAGPIVGFVVALGHVVVAGIATGFLPAGQLVDAGIDPPGAFLEYRGLVVMGAFVVAHLLFGVLVGTLYGRVRHSIVVHRTAAWIDVTRP
jgi:hypothetical protein